MSISTLLVPPETALLPTPHEIASDLPLSHQQHRFIAEARLTVCNILDGTDRRTLLICGPCSIHDIESTTEYAQRLLTLSREVADQFYIIMRTYFDKPRTLLGWPGFATDPNLDGSDDVSKGIKLTRQLLLHMAEIELPAAAEILNPLYANYFGDLLTWGCIGARTAESQIHRQIAASLPMPIAFKNNTSGCIDVAVNGAVASSHPHTYLGLNSNGQLSALKAEGNTHTHIVLRGSDTEPNYREESILASLKKLTLAQLPQRLLIDCSHGNSQRQHEKQIQVFDSVLKQILSGNTAIRGMILESHINGGNQSPIINKADLKYAVSITDPCLDWNKTEQLIKEAHAQLHKAKIYNL